MCTGGPRLHSVNYFAYPFFPSLFPIVFLSLGGILKHSSLSLSRKLRTKRKQALIFTLPFRFDYYFFPYFARTSKEGVSVFFVERARDENTYQKRERDLFIVSKHDSSLRRATERGRRRGLMNESPDIHRGEGGGNKGGEPRPREDGGLP